MAAFAIAQEADVHLPPGPPKLPVIGNVALMGRDKAWEVFEEWSKKLNSDVTSLSGLGHVAIVANSYTSRRLTRPQQHLQPPAVHVYGALRVVEPAHLLPCDERWKMERRFCHKAIGTRSSLAKYDQTKELLAAKFAKGWMERPDALEEFCHIFAGDLILRVTYGYESKGYDPMIKLGEEVTEAAAESGSPGKWMVDVLPFLRHVPDWFPFTGWKRVVRTQRELMEEFANKPFDWDEGRAAPSFVSELMSEKDLTPEKAFAIRWCATVLFGGGSHTTVWTIYALMKMLCLHPEVQARAQAEIDEVIGSNRLPQTSDKNPCHTCGPAVWKPSDGMLSSLLRFLLAIPHFATEDNAYDGYAIPKGSIVMANLWAISRDEREYPDPHNFKPERFLVTSRNGARKIGSSVLAVVSAQVK
ncbi:cytochrome P450 [Schizophyllum amplum]|uniref:Cytochrome P450 n=1 Tax=Schizophyllum amplum TaxID=97359 RepID=A0A550C4V7_9AGAR|nr:cytochrome P450 [Auriculariopsis ampla]